MIWFILWVGLAVLVGYYYKEKGLNSILGFLLSLFASPIVAFLIGALVSPGQEVFEKLKKCPQCQEAVKAKAKICRFCGYEFEEAELEKEITKEELVKLQAERVRRKKLNLVFFVIFLVGTVIASLTIITFVNRQIESGKKIETLRK